MSVKDRPVMAMPPEDKVHEKTELWEGAIRVGPTTYRVRFNQVKGPGGTLQIDSDNGPQLLRGLRDVTELIELSVLLKTVANQLTEFCGISTFGRDHDREYSINTEMPKTGEAEVTLDHPIGKPMLAIEEKSE